MDSILNSSGCAAEGTLFPRKVGSFFRIGQRLGCPHHVLWYCFLGGCSLYLRRQSFILDGKPAVKYTIFVRQVYELVVGFKQRGSLTGSAHRIPCFNVFSSLCVRGSRNLHDTLVQKFPAHGSSDCLRTRPRVRLIPLQLLRRPPPPPRSLCDQARGIDTLGGQA